MKKNIIYIAALAVVAAACSNEDDIFVTNPENNNATGDVKMITETITATNGDDATRADVAADAKFTWSAGDQIAVHVSDGKYYTTNALADDGGLSADFTVTYPDGEARDAYAVYPASIADAANYGQSGATLNVTLPGSYTLAQVSGTTTPCPMIATNTAGSDWTFKQLCGLVRLTVKGIPSDAIGMVIQFPGKKVKGSFSVTDPGTTTPTIATSTPATGEDKITVTFDAGTTEATVNLPLPTGAYDDVYITPVGSSTKVAALRHIKAGGYTAARARAKKLTTTMVAFSVSGTKKVIFAPGNLQATYNASAQTWTWKFATRQHEKMGYNIGNQSVSTETKETSAPWAKLRSTPEDNTSAEVSGTVDLFGRSTSETYYGIARSTDLAKYNGTFVDWGNNTIGGYASGFWSTPSSAEWAYVVGKDEVSHSNYRKTGGTIAGVENVLCTKATVNSIKGFIIFPDNYGGGTPEGVTWVTGNFSNGNYANSGATGWGTTISATAWEVLEATGCVFLPVAGMRVCYIQGFYNYVYKPDEWGFYNSSDFNLFLRFNDAGFDPLNGNSPQEYSGVSVRLVHEL